MTTETTAGKLHTIAKWSLIIGPILVVVFNFLLPTNGASPVDPERPDLFIPKLGGDADIAQIYMVVILLGIILFTRGIVGIYQASAEGSVARQRLGVGMLGSVAALSLWGIVLGLGLAEASTAKSAIAGSAEAGAAALAIHAAFFGAYQVATYVAYRSLIPIGGGVAASGIVRKEFGWVISLVGVATIVLTSIMPVKTEAGTMVFGIMAVIWGVVFLYMGLQNHGAANHASGHELDDRLLGIEKGAHQGGAFLLL